MLRQHCINVILMPIGFRLAGQWIVMLMIGSHGLVNVEAFSLERDDYLDNSHWTKYVYMSSS